MALPLWFLVSMDGKRSQNPGPLPHYNHSGPLTNGATSPGCHFRSPLCHGVLGTPAFAFKPKNITENKFKGLWACHCIIYFNKSCKIRMFKVEGIWCMVMEIILKENLYKLMVKKCVRSTMYQNGTILVPYTMSILELQRPRSQTPFGFNLYVN